VVFALGPEVLPLFAVQPLGIGLIGAGLRNGFLLSAHLGRRGGILRPGRSRTDRERKEYCSNDRRFHHHVLSHLLFPIGLNHAGPYFRRCQHEQPAGVKAKTCGITGRRIYRFAYLGYASLLSCFLTSRGFRSFKVQKRSRLTIPQNGFVGQAPLTV